MAKRKYKMKLLTKICTVGLIGGFLTMPVGGLILTRVAPSIAPTVTTIGGLIFIFSLILGPYSDLDFDDGRPWGC